MLRDIIRVVKGELSSTKLEYLQRICDQHIEYQSKLNHTIRDMDQRIFDMAQKTSWDGMRPIFASLCEETNHRMKIESGRIRDLLTAEIHRTYTK